MTKGLMPMQALFVQEYLVDLNATAAAKRAGYSPKTAYSIGQENLKKPELKSAIQQAKKARRERTFITQDRILLELAAAAFADMSQSAETCLKWNNKLKALELLSKHLGLFEAKAREANTPAKRNNLLEAIQNIGEIDTSDLSEVE